MYHPLSFPCSHNMLAIQWPISEKNIGVEDVEFPGVKGSGNLREI